MHVLIMTNGCYGDLQWYRDNLRGFSKIICADGAAGTALKIGAALDAVVGDMDSIDSGARGELERSGTRLLVYPPEKDPTDTQIAYELALDEGATRITVWGGTGSRLDHTLSTIMNAFMLVDRGVEVCFASPGLDIHLVRGSVAIHGLVGETVSLIVLGEEARGVTLEGFRYPLDNAVVRGSWQFCVSNLITGPDPVVRVASGNVAVFHYRVLPE